MAGICYLSFYTNSINSIAGFFNICAGKFIFVEKSGMKIRCEQNSIRLRLRRSELVQLRVEKWLGVVINLPDGKEFGWDLLLDDDLTDMTAALQSGRISIKVPVGMAFHWMDTDEVGMERFLPIGGGTALHILVEKDFPCKDRPEEDKSDFFAELSEEAPVKC